MTSATAIRCVAALGLSLGAGCSSDRPGPVIPDHPFVRPAGPHPVGTREYFWIDSTRGEGYTTDPTDRRRVLVQVWYPAEAGGIDTAAYLLRPDDFADSAGAALARGARTNSVLEAPVAESGGSGWPVLLYNHGGGWTRWSATFTTEWLASHGYVVFSVEHFGFNQTARFPDGTPFVADTLAFPTPGGDLAADARASWAYLEDPVFSFWRADARFALDQIERLQREDGPFHARLDLTRIGAFGWSFGGALAVELSAVDPRVIAAVDHDGQLFGQVREQGTTRPVLLFHHGDDDALGVPEGERPALRKLIAEVSRADTATRVRSSGPWYSVTIERTSHGDFSDLSLFYPRSKKAIDPSRAHEIINAYTLGFFDQFLRGKPSALLSGASSPYRDAVLRPWD